MKKLIYIALIVIFAFTPALAGCNSSEYASYATTSSEVEDHTSKPPVEEISIQKTKDKTVKKEPVIYNILGKSNKLTKREIENMDKWRSDVVQAVKANPDWLYINGYTDEKKIALSFDDGPDLNITPKVLDILKANNIKGNFFFIGDRVQRFPSVVKRADAEGNLVLSHSFSHPDLTKMTEAEIQNQISKSETAIYNVIGKKPAIVRPPYGGVNNPVINIAKKNNFKLVLWSIDTLDWSQREKDNIIKNVIDNVRPGDIILMHSNDDKAATMQALPELIIKLKDKGYRFVDLGELLNVKPYK
jgi:peptidoglycan/xylan/chitin deacetylase (PgdA/CDA1 family)